MKNEKTNKKIQNKTNLKKLFETLVKNKDKIISITLAGTLLSIIYVFTVPKIFEAKAIVKIGEYKSGGYITKIADVNELTKELQVLYIELLKNIEDREAWIEKIYPLQKQKYIFEIISRSNSNNHAISEIQKVINFIQKKHSKILNDMQEASIASIEEEKSKLLLLQTSRLQTLTLEINKSKKKIKKYEQIQEKLINFQKLNKSNPILADINAVKRKNIEDSIMRYKKYILALEDKKFNLEIIELPKIKNNIINLKSLLKPHNYKNTEIIGHIIINDHSIQPKKMLIVIIVFITTLILSIFIVFFLKFIQNTKNKENS